MNYDNAFFDLPIDRRGTACEKWDCLMEREKRELNPMWVADMDFRCAPEIVEALVKRASHPVYGYTEQTDSAVEALLDFMRRRHGISLTKEQQTLMPCVITGLRAAVCALTKAGDSVIVQPPVYGPFFASTKDNERKLAESPLIRDENGRYTMDFDGIKRMCKSGARLMLLCNPHNPVGRVWTREELQTLLDILQRYDVTLVSDEIHEDFVYRPNAFHPILSLATADDAKVVALTSASKTFNLAGLQQAVLFTRNQPLKEAMEQAMRAAGVVQGNIFALTATEAAYRYGDAWLDGLLVYLKQADTLLRTQLAERLPKAVVSPLDATYLNWIDLRAYGFTTEELMRRTHEAGVAFTPGTFFSERYGEGFLRLNLACPHAQTLDAIQKLENAVKGVK